MNAVDKFSSIYKQKHLQHLLKIELHSKTLLLCNPHIHMFPTIHQPMRRSLSATHCHENGSNIFHQTLKSAAFWENIFH